MVASTRIPTTLPAHTDTCPRLACLTEPPWLDRPLERSPLTLAPSIVKTCQDHLGMATRLFPKLPESTFLRGR